MKLSVSLFGVIVSLFFVSCNLKQEKTSTNEKSRMEWVYINIDSKMAKDTSSYFYYGQVSSETLLRLKSDQTKGMFSLENIRYFNTDDLLEIYEDMDYKGEKLFKLADVSRVDILKKDPVLIFDSVELAKSAKIFLKQKRSSKDK